MKDLKSPQTEFEDYENVRLSVLELTEACKKLNFSRAKASVNLAIAFNLPFNVTFHLGDNGEVGARVTLDLLAAT